MPLSIFGFRALWSPWFFLIIVGLVILYFLIATVWRDRFQGSEPLKRSEVIYFLSSMVLLYIIKGSPVDLLGHILFSIHMTQMALLLLMVAPFLIKGIPRWMWENLFTIKALDSIFKFFTKPLISLLTFSLLFSMYHYPMILDNIKLSFVAHSAFSITIFIAAIFLWWPLLNTLKDHPKIHGLKKIGYVILSAILITPACTLIIFADVPVYETYHSGEAWLKAMALCVPAGTLSGLAGLGISGPEMFTNMDTLYDQQLGGILMKVSQEVIYVVVIAKIFFTWAQEEKDNADDITAQDLSNYKKLTMHG